MAIAFVSNSVGDSGSTTTSWSATIDVGTGRNRALIVGIKGLAWDVDVFASGSVTYAGVAMTKIAQKEGIFDNGDASTYPPSRYLYLFGLANPASGSNSMAVSGSNSFYQWNANTYTGVSAADFPHSSATGATGSMSSFSSTHSTTAINPSVSNCWLVGATDPEFGRALGAGSNATLRAQYDAHGIGMYDSNATVSGATSLNYQLTSGTTAWTSVTAAISPYPQGVTSINGIAVANITAVN